MKTRIQLLKAENIAGEVVTLLAPMCQRIEIAGSIRRRKPEVGDIEIVAIPRMIPDKNIFGEVVGEHSALDDLDFTMLGRVIKNGSKYKQVELNGGIGLDLFIVTPPAQWGVLFMIRTGSADFSHRMVTQKNKRGALPSNCKVEHGAVWRNGGIIPMPEEEDYFKICGMAIVPPEER